MLTLLKRHHARKSSQLRHPSTRPDLRIHNLLDDPNLRRAMGLDRIPTDTHEPRDRRRRRSKDAAAWFGAAPVGVASHVSTSGARSELEDLTDGERTEPRPKQLTRR